MSTASAAAYSDSPSSGQCTRHGGADLVAEIGGERRERRLAARDRRDHPDDRVDVVERLCARHRAEPGGHDRRYRAIVEHDGARRDRAVTAAEHVDRRRAAREALEHAQRFGGGQVRRRVGERRTRPVPRRRACACAIEAERALHERALRAAEQACALERGGGLVAGVEALDHDRAIEHGVDGARELRDRRLAERRLELVARARPRPLRRAAAIECGRSSRRGRGPSSGAPPRSSASSSARADRRASACARADS